MGGKVSAVVPHRRDIAERLAGIRGIVWDLDNTLYRLDDMIEEAFNIAFARAAVESGVPLTLEKAIELSRKSWLEHGYSGHVFVRDFGLKPEDLHHHYHGFMDETVIKKSLEVKLFFESLPLNHVLVTHSHRSWALRVLRHLDLQDWFPEERVLGLEDYDFRHKHACRTCFDKALGLLGLEPHEALMAEDTLPNLKIPHELGMATAFIHHGRKPEATPEFVHLSCNSTLDLLKCLSDSRG